MFDLKFPAEMPFKQVMAISVLWGASFGLFLGIGMTVAILLAEKFHLIAK